MGTILDYVILKNRSHSMIICTVGTPALGSAQQTVQTAEQCRLEILSYSACSPDLAPSDFYSFPTTLLKTSWGPFGVIEDQRQPVHKKVISDFPALHQASLPVVGLEPATRVHKVFRTDLLTTMPPTPLPQTIESY
ncbi:hypothetical protein PoB_001299500 [Plakobranchus ocellatus]|uniref:Uncharacterized protein n=1 Tax=Plakobranchus ocellatus TaxID=259542 RepID=A0AAV3YUH7_9GAST|nr:hypothetical protein PoB_001299500 [Plakobranchus ocellatus]